MTMESHEMDDSARRADGGGSRGGEFLARGGARCGGCRGRRRRCSGSTGAFASLGGAGRQVGGKLSVLNWPLYIDKKSPKHFQAQTGIDLKYSESLNDNNEFFAKYQRQLSQDQYPGFDIAVPTSWMAKRLIDLGYVQKLPLDDIPNAANLSPRLQDPPWDPTGEYTLPWQTGMIGHRVQPRDHGPRADERRRPLRQEVQEQDRHAQETCGRP